MNITIGQLIKVNGKPYKVEAPTSKNSVATLIPQWKCLFNTQKTYSVMDVMLGGMGGLDFFLIEVKGKDLPNVRLELKDGIFHQWR